MIFDGLPLAMAGGGSKLYGPRLVIAELSYTKNSPATIRLEGKGILSFYGSYSTSGFIGRPIYSFGSQGSITCEVDGHDIDNLGFTGSLTANTFVTGYSGWVPKKITTDSSSTNIPSLIPFDEYFQLTFSVGGSLTPTITLGLEYYDVDEEDNVTVSII